MSFNKGIRSETRRYDDTIIVEPRSSTFDKIRNAIANAPRPLKLTFICGERREEAFREQEERRVMSKNDVRIHCGLDALRRFRYAQEAARAVSTGRVDAACEAALRSVLATDDGGAANRHPAIRDARAAVQFARAAGAASAACAAAWRRARVREPLNDSDDDDASDCGASALGDDAVYVGAVLSPAAPPPPKSPRTPSVARAEDAVARLERAVEAAESSPLVCAQRPPDTHSETWATVLEEVAPASPGIWHNARLRGVSSLVGKDLYTRALDRRSSACQRRGLRRRRRRRGPPRCPGSRRTRRPRSPPRRRRRRRSRARSRW